MQLLPIEAYAALDAAQEIASAAAKALNAADAAWRKSKSKVRAQAFQEAHDAFQAAMAECDACHRQVEEAERAARLGARAKQKELQQQLDLFA